MCHWAFHLQTHGPHPAPGSQVGGTLPGQAQGFGRVSGQESETWWKRKAGRRVWHQRHQDRDGSEGPGQDRQERQEGGGGEPSVRSNCGRLRTITVAPGKGSGEGATPAERHGESAPRVPGVGAPSSDILRIWNSMSRCWKAIRHLPSFCSRLGPWDLPISFLARTHLSSAACLDHQLSPDTNWARSCCA